MVCTEDRNNAYKTKVKHTLLSNLKIVFPNLPCHQDILFSSFHTPLHPDLKNNINVNNDNAYIEVQFVEKIRNAKSTAG